MSVRDRLRPSASLTTSSIMPQIQHNNSKPSSIPYTRLILSCDDTSATGDVHREYVFIRGVHRTIDFVRGTASAAAVASGFVLNSDGAVRAAFTSPVMSRRHARITFVDDGSVVVADVGSMHGTFLAGPNLIGGLDHPDMLKPRRNYSLHDGDVLLFGKSINREDRDWKPVTVRVTLRHEEDRVLASPAPIKSIEPVESADDSQRKDSPNRFGVFINSSGSSVAEDDDIDSSSSSDADDTDSQALSISSPDSSPLAPHMQLQVLSQHIRKRSSASASTSSSVAMMSRDEEKLATSAVDLDPASALIEQPAPAESSTTRSATSALKSALSMRLPAIRQLPSLKDLGLFRTPVVSVAPSPPELPAPMLVARRGPGSSQNEPLVIDSDDEGRSTKVQISSDVIVGGADTTLAISSPISPPVSTSTQQRVDREAESQFDSRAANESIGSSGSSRWLEPSYPQNQLGLKMSLGPSNDDGQGFDMDKFMEDYIVESRPLPFMNDELGDFGDSVPALGGLFGAEGDGEAESAMDISPLASSRNSPNVRARSVLAADVPGLPAQSQPMNVAERGRIVVDLVEDDGKTPEVEERKRSTPKKKSSLLPRRPRSPHPNMFSRRRRSDKSKSRSPRLTTRDLREAMTHVAQISFNSGSNLVTSNLNGEKEQAIEVAVQDLSELVRDYAKKVEASRGRAKDIGNIEAKVDETVKKNDLEEMRKDMRRLSDLVTTLVDKVEAQARDTSDVADTEGSRKRKRSPSPSPSSHSALSDTGVELKRGMRIEELEQELSRLRALPRSYSTSELPVAKKRDQEILRPVKRLRTERREGGIGKSMVAAAGYTTLGAALAWAALAYAL